MVKITETNTENEIEAEPKLDPFQRIEIARKTLEYIIASDVKKKRDLASILKVIANAANVKLGNDSEDY